MVRDMRKWGLWDGSGEGTWNGASLNVDIMHAFPVRPQPAPPLCLPSALLIFPSAAANLPSMTSTCSRAPSTWPSAAATLNPIASS